MFVAQYCYKPKDYIYKEPLLHFRSLKIMSCIYLPPLWALVQCPSCALFLTHRDCLPSGDGGEDSSQACRGRGKQVLKMMCNNYAPTVMKAHSESSFSKHVFIEKENSCFPWSQIPVWNISLSFLMRISGDVCVVCHCLNKKIAKLKEVRMKLLYKNPFWQNNCLKMLTNSNKYCMFVGPRQLVKLLKPTVCTEIFFFS